MKGRALTLKRYPDGVEKGFFFEKHCPSYRPSWVKTAEIPQDDGERMTVCLVNDLNALIWVGNLASLELHVPLARADSPETPDAVVFDLDPGDQAGILDCARVALIIRDLLSELRLTGYAKTSGQKGLHVFVPLNRKESTFADTKRFSKAVAEVLQRNYPEMVTAKMAKEERKKKVFINWSQNDASKTMICVYSLRATGKAIRFLSPCLEGAGGVGRAGRSGKAARPAFGRAAPNRNRRRPLSRGAHEETEASLSIDGFGKSPDAALSFILRRCSVPQSTPHSQDSLALPAELFTKPS